MSKRLKRLVNLREKLKLRAEGAARAAELELANSQANTLPRSDFVAERKIEDFLIEAQAEEIASAFHQHLKQCVEEKKVAMQSAYQEHKQVEKIYARQLLEVNLAKQKREAQQVDNWLRSQGVKP